MKIKINGRVYDESAQYGALETENLQRVLSWIQSGIMSKFSRGLVPIPGSGLEVEAEYGDEVYRWIHRAGSGNSDLAEMRLLCAEFLDEYLHVNDRLPLFAVFSRDSLNYDECDRVCTLKGLEFSEHDCLRMSWTPSSARLFFEFCKIEDDAALSERELSPEYRRVVELLVATVDECMMLTAKRDRESHTAQLYFLCKQSALSFAELPAETQTRVALIGSIAVRAALLSPFCSFAEIEGYVILKGFHIDLVEECRRAFPKINFVSSYACSEA